MENDETPPQPEHEEDDGRKSLRERFGSKDAGDKKKTDGEHKDEIDIETGVAPSDHAMSPGDSTVAHSNNKKKQHFGAAKRKLRQTKEDWTFFKMFLSPRKETIISYLKMWTLLVFLPLMAIAAALFYCNPSAPPDFRRDGASISWFILFLLRQTVNFSMARAIQLIVIDYLSLQRRFTIRFFGPRVTLVIVQSKGYPFLMFVWGLLNFCLLSGTHKLAKHWLFWQDFIAFLSPANPAGTITESAFNYKINATAMAVGLIVALKRFGWGLYIGKSSYCKFRSQSQCRSVSIYTF